MESNSAKPMFKAAPSGSVYYYELKIAQSMIYSIIIVLVFPIKELMKDLELFNREVVIIKKVITPVGASILKII